MRDQGLWTWHIISGIVILLFLGLHMGIMHLDYVLGIYNPAGGHPIDWANVVARAKSVLFTVTYVLLLGAALFHGFYGLRNIVFELGPSSRVTSAVNWLCVIAGAGLFGLGSWAAWASLRLAKNL